MFSQNRFHFEDCFSCVGSKTTIFFKFDLKSIWILNNISGYAGINCQENINECQNVNCRHGGTCVDGLGSYTCSCLQGYTGSHCEVVIDVCDSQPCQHGGSCFNFSTNLGIKYECRCLVGTSGLCFKFTFFLSFLLWNLELGLVFLFLFCLNLKFVIWLKGYSSKIE